MIHERADQRLGALVRDDRDFHPARVFQARGEEVDALLRGIEKADVDVTKVVLREFAGQPFKADEGRTVVGRSALIRS